MSDTIQVVVRLRPLNDSENHNGSSLAWQTRDKRIISSAQEDNETYIFDRVYDCKDSTSDIFLETVEPIICAAMEGFNGTIFAYGQTSSGKTYTMSGTKNEKGIIPMAMKSMFTAIDNAPNRQFLMRVSYMEIYNEKITDLLDPEEKTLKLMEDENRFVHVSGLKENVLQNIDDMLTIKKKGDALRRVAETARNEESSRSHAIFRIIIESQERQDNDEDLRDESVRLSLLYFIDLAGSEKSSENTGDQFREGCAINKSLLILGQVIGKLSDGTSKHHINYRDSKLTRLLQNGLGGNSKTAIICTVNPTAIEETHSTLRFASRAKTIKNQPMLNEFTDVSNKAILKRYQREIQQLKKQLESYKRQTPQKNLNPYYEYINNEKEKEQLEKKYQNTIDALKKICVSTSENTKQKIIRRKTWCPGLLKRKIEPPILDTCGTPARFLDSIAETSVSDEEEKNDDTSNFQKRVSNSKRLMNQISCSVQTESVDENEHFLKFENEMLKNMLMMKENELNQPSPVKKPRLSIDHNETKEFLELELQCVNDGIKLSVEEEKIEKERQKLKEEKVNHDKELSLLKEREMDEDESLTKVPELKESKMDETVKELKDKLSDKSQECLALSKELFELKERNMDMKKTVKELEEKLSDKLQECLALSKVSSDFKEKKVEENKIVKDLEEKLSDKSQECLVLSKELSEFERRNMDMNKTLKELEEKLSDKSQECLALSNVLSEFKERKMEDGDIMKDLEEKLSDKSQECLALSRELSDFKESKIEGNKIVKYLEEKLSDKSQECLAISKKLFELEGRNIDVNKTVKELEEKLSDKSQECLALSKELSEFKERKMEQNNIVKDLEKKLSDKSKECLDLTKVLSELKESKMEIEKNFECEFKQKCKEQIDLSNELAALKQDKENQINVLEKQLGVKAQEYTCLSKDLESLKTTQACIQLDLKKKLKEKCQLYECQLNEFDSIQQKYSSLQEAMLELKSDIAKKYNEIKERDLEIEELRYQVLDLQSQLTKRDQLCVTPETSNKSVNKESSKVNEDITNNSSIQKPNTSQVYDESTVQNLLQEKVQECSFLTEKLENMQKDIGEKTNMLKKMKREKLVQSELMEEYAVKAELTEYFRKELENQMNTTSNLKEQLERQKETCIIPGENHGSSRSNVQECSACVALAAQVKEAEEKQRHVITCLQNEIKDCMSKIEELGNENVSDKVTIQKLENDVKEKQECITNMKSKLVKDLDTHEVEDMKKQLANNFMSLARAETTNKITKVHFTKLEDSYKETITILENKIKCLQQELRLAQMNSNENTIKIQKEVPTKSSNAGESNVIPSRGFVDQLAMVSLEADKAKLTRKMDILKQKLANSLKNNEELKKELAVHKNVSSMKKLAVVNISTGTETCEAVEPAANLGTPSTPSRKMKDDCKNQ